MTSHDVYSYGVVSSSTLYSVHGAFPEAEGYAEIDNVRFMTGGEATNSSIVLARLGVRVKLDGNWLGADENGMRTSALLAERDIDISRLTLREGYEGVQELVIAADGTRTIFGTYGRLLEEAAWNVPEERDITAAKVVCLDPFFVQPAARVAEIAHCSNIPVVTVDCRYDDPLLRHTSAVVIAKSFIRENYGDKEVAEVFAAYRAATNGLVIFTFGDAPIWFARPNETVKRFKPYTIEPTDTTGGGDSFRAGIVYGFLRAWGDDKMIEFAAAVAAITCTRFPGVQHSPTYDEATAFVQAHPE